jgi:hypothetical protein
MLFYALTDSRLAGAELGEVVEFYATLDEAERARRDAISDELTWVNDLAVVEVELGSSSSN